MARDRDRDFTFHQRKNTVCIDVNSVFKERGEKPGKSDVVDFLKNDLKLEEDDVKVIQLHSLLKFVFVKVVTDDLADLVATRLAGGVRWSRCDQIVYGWRCDSTVTIVKIVNVPPELDLSIVVKEMEEYGEVKNCKRTMFEGWKGAIDGSISLSLKKTDGVVLPNFVRRNPSSNEDAGVWQVIFRGQGDSGCWKCGETGHIGRFCGNGARRNGGRSYSAAVQRSGTGLSLRDEGERIVRMREEEERRLTRNEEGKKKAAEAHAEAQEVRRRRTETENRRKEGLELNRKEAEEEEVKRREAEEEVKRREAEEEVKRRQAQEQVKRMEAEKEVKRKEAEEEVEMIEVEEQVKRMEVEEQVNRKEAEEEVKRREADEEVKRREAEEEDLSKRVDVGDESIMEEEVEVQEEEEEEEEGGINEEVEDDGSGDLSYRVQRLDGGVNFSTPSPVSLVSLADSASGEGSEAGQKSGAAGQEVEAVEREVMEDCDVSSGSSVLDFGQQVKRKRKGKKGAEGLVNFPSKQRLTELELARKKTVQMKIKAVKKC
jgi:hypothetical protein